MSLLASAPAAWAGTVAVEGGATAVGQRAVTPVNCADVLGDEITDAAYDTAEGRDCVRLLATSVTDVADRHNISLPQHLAQLPAKLAPLRTTESRTAARPRATAPADAATPSAELEAARLVARTLTKAAARTDAALAAAKPSLPAAVGRADGASGKAAAQPVAFMAPVRGANAAAQAPAAPVRQQAARAEFQLSPIVVIGARDRVLDPAAGSYSGTLYGQLNFGSWGAFEAVGNAYASASTAYLKFGGFNYYAPGLQVSLDSNLETATVTKTIAQSINNQKITYVVSARLGTLGEFKGASIRMQNQMLWDPSIWWEISADYNRLGFKLATYNISPAFPVEWGLNPNLGWTVTYEGGVNYNGGPYGSLAVATQYRGMWDLGVNLGYSQLNGFYGQAQIRFIPNW